METNKRPIALILGGSSGLGAATAQKLGKAGYDLVIVHRDRKADMLEIESFFDQLRQEGIECHSFNNDAVTLPKQQELWTATKSLIKNRKIKVLVHSIAKGNLKPMTGSTGVLTNQDFHLTLQAMAVSLFDWVKLIVEDDFFDSDARVIAFTSEGNSKAWRGYAAVSAAKVSLEAIVRNIALEFASMGIKANCIQAGVTDTKSLRMIPGHEILIEKALKRNPNKRLTSPADVANAVYLLTLPEARWITGTVIKVDGGESLQ
ncbi:SDR family oxidoreductase [Flagellimonas ochracea]|nr:SDR family oxidoreductase [Allomuricauda ochracea]